MELFGARNAHYSQVSGRSVMSTPNAPAHAVRRYCRRFDERRLSSMLAPNAQLDYFGFHVAGRREIEKFVGQLPPTQHHLDIVDVAPRANQREHDVEGDVAPLSDADPFPTLPSIGAPQWDSDDNSMDVAMPQTPPQTPLRPMDVGGSPCTPDNPIPVHDDILNAPRPLLGKRRRLHLETEEKVAKMMVVGGNVTWTEAIGRLLVAKEQEQPGEISSTGKNIKLRLGTTVAEETLKVVGIVYFDTMKCRKKLTFRADD